MEDLTVFLRRMPKVELHVHLESTMPGEMLARFASRQGRELPRPAEQLYDCSAEDLSDFLSFLDRICSFVGTPAELTEAAEHAALAAGEENILYSELILNPTHWPQFTAAEIIAAVTAGFDRAAERGGADCRFTLSLSRTQTGEEAMALVETMRACRTPRLAGLSIDGNEALAGRTGERFRPAFLAAKAAGFGCTVHAGESSGPEGVRDALDLLRADRLDHGVRAAEDPALVDRLVRERVPLNICLTSNLTLLYRRRGKRLIRSESEKLSKRLPVCAFWVLALAGVSALALGVTALVSPGSVNGYDVIFGLCAALIAALGGYGFAVRERLRTSECGEED